MTAETTRPRVRIEIPGPVAPKQSVRVRHGKHFHQERDSPMMRYERTCAHLAKVAMVEHMKGKPYPHAPVELRAFLFIEVPRSWPKAKRELALTGRIEPTVKPDFDNGIKGAMDGIKEILFRDDCYVTKATIEKVFSQSAGAHIVVIWRTDKECVQADPRR